MIFDAHISMKAELRYLGFIFLFSLNSCYIADSLFIVTPPDPPESLQVKVEKTVQFHIQNKLENEIYRVYGFSPIVITVPAEIIELEELEQQRNKQQASNPDLDTLIQNKKDEIRLFGIQRSVITNHFFTLKANNNITIIESQFVLNQQNDSLQVVEVKPKILLEISEVFESIFETYFYEYTIFLGKDYFEGRKLSNRFYTFFKSHQENLSGIREKSAFLKHTLILTKYVKDVGKFDQKTICENLVKAFITQTNVSITEYEPREFSVLYEKTESDMVSGYYIFHKFIGRFGDEVDLFAIQVNFSPYFEVLSFSFLDKPYDAYFN